jgi:hypothetical protein
MPASVHAEEPQEVDQSMLDAEPEVDPIMLEEKRVIVVRIHSTDRTENLSSLALLYFLPEKIYLY